MSTVDSKPGLGIWGRKLTRRNGLIVAGAVAGTAVGMTVGEIVGNDLVQGQAENYSQYGDLSRIEEELVFLERHNINVPRDRLYGYTFPSTFEVAAQYRQLTLETPVVVIHQKEPTYFTRRVMQALGKEARIAYDPHVLKSENRLFVVLPPSYSRKEIYERAVTLYHEGIHAFYQDIDKAKHFEEESMANIAGVLLYHEMRRRGIISPMDISNMDIAYILALESGDKRVWERQLRRLYDFD